MTGKPKDGMRVPRALSKARSQPTVAEDDISQAIRQARQKPPYAPASASREAVSHQRESIQQFGLLMTIHALDIAMLEQEDTHANQIDISEAHRIASIRERGRGAL